MSVANPQHLNCTAHPTTSSPFWRVGSTIQKIGYRGGIVLPDLLGMRLTVFLAVFIPLLVVGLFVLERLAP